MVVKLLPTILIKWICFVNNWLNYFREDIQKSIKYRKVTSPGSSELECLSLDWEDVRSNPDWNQAVIFWHSTLLIRGKTGAIKQTILQSLLAKLNGTTLNTWYQSTRSKIRKEFKNRRKTINVWILHHLMNSIQGLWRCKLRLFSSCHIQGFGWN